MSNLIYYERYLPHRLPPGETIFITFRLAGSLPQEALLRLQAEAQLVLPDDDPPLARTLQLLKGYSSFQANKLLGQSGAFWQAESYDHVVRPGELDRIISYILENPVKAGLVEEWQQWPYSYLAPQ